MSRPPSQRIVRHQPSATLFKPRGVPAAYLDEVTLALDEVEAMRLADCEGLYQADAAVRMNVSRATFGRIIESAHRKVADALVYGKALVIEGGNVTFVHPAAALGAPGRGPGRGMGRGWGRGHGRHRHGHGGPNSTGTER